jgi:CRISPR/Cas system endoribonuclease Cas6 (RAMP superfamily)
MSNTIVSRKNMIIYIHDHVNELQKKHRIDLLVMIINTSLPESLIQEKANGTQFNISKCNDEIVERMYNFIKSHNSVCIANPVVKLEK